MATNVEFVGKLPDELLCSICMKVLNEPQMVNCCEQKFCKKCLTKWLTKRKTCLACPQACGVKVLRKDLTAHQGVCPLETVACPFSDISC